MQYDCSDRGGSTALSSTVVVGESHRLDCSNKPGQMKFDNCGVCGGSNDCIDCNNNAHGGKMCHQHMKPEGAAIYYW